jgi:hypothetical protein
MMIEAGWRKRQEAGQPKRMYSVESHPSSLRSSNWRSPSYGDTR